jgi:hypothetical protein
MEEPRLGCKAHELEVGTEFSQDEGRTWLVVMTEPQYRSTEDWDNTLVFQAGESGSGPGRWETVTILDSEHVLLEREWKSEKASPKG